MTRRLQWGAVVVLVLCAVWPERQGALGSAAVLSAGMRLPNRLADTGLYEADGRTVAARNRPFAPQYPLWSDGLTKRRWVFLPDAATIDTTDAGAWRMPVGTRFWKEFSLRGRKVETRLSWQTAPGAWTFASYVWNEEGTDATLAPDEGVRTGVEIVPGKRHDVPSRSDCSTCHGTTRVGPLGFNVLQLSPERDPNAIHGEPLAPGMLTLRELVDEGRVSLARDDLAAAPPRIRTSNPRTRAVLGYLVANCGSCHDGTDTVSVVGPSLTIADLLEDGDGAAKRLIARSSTWRVPGAGDHESALVRPGSPDTSALFVRMRSRAPSSQMPPLGTVTRDRLALDTIAAWIATDAPALANEP